ncbi:MAG: IS21 family transposase [Chloroflexi bacterium]|nr:IS21 family transposase [Chloroflexota bacterium]
MEQVVEIYLHWQAGRSIQAISRSLGVDRKTIRKYLRLAEAAGLTREQARSAEEWRRFVREGLGIEHERPRSGWFAELDRHQEFIREQLKTNRMSTVHRRLVERTGLPVSVATFRRYVHATMPEALPQAPVTVWRPEVEPGEEAQVDFGFMGEWLDPVRGCRHRTWAFTMVLSYSRHMFVRFVLRMDRQTWLLCHVEAFAFFAGVVRRVILDNLKDGVLKPDLYDPTLNRAYAELAAHYGFLIDPARGGHPKDKPRVERQMPYVRESLWRGDADKLLSLEAMNQRALEWCREVAGLRIHGTTHRRPLEVFQAEEKPRLQRLPATPWEPSTWTTAKVGPDAHCQVAGALYSVPHSLRGQRLDVRLTQKLVEFYRGEELVKVHPRRHDRGRTTDPADLPPDKVAFYERTPRWCLKRAQELGPDVLEAVRSLLAVDTLTHLRQAQGILRLEQTYGAERLNAACQRAVAFGDPRYRTVKTILARGLDQEPLPEAPPPAKAGAYLRGREAFTFPMAGR